MKLELNLQTVPDLTLMTHIQYPSHHGDADDVCLISEDPRMPAAPSDLTITITHSDEMF